MERHQTKLHLSEDCVTTKDQKCVFPFNYNGSPRNQCINEGYDYEGAVPKYWCATATDENGDMVDDDQWGVCSKSCYVRDEGCFTTGKEAISNTEKPIGKKCVFPFNYNGSPRHHCIKEDSPDHKHYWCATAVDENGDFKGTPGNDEHGDSTWGYCAPSCDTGDCVTVSGPQAGEKCVFPFRLWDGTLQNYCITTDHDKLWCATEVDEEGNYVKGQWGECSLDCGVESCTSARAQEECKSKPPVKFGDQFSQYYCLSTWIFRLGSDPSSATGYACNACLPMVGCGHEI